MTHEAVRHAIAIASIVLVLGLGCQSSDDPTITVFAASSLTDAFAELEREFEASEAGLDVEIAYAGSQALRLQLEQGATADVFASANPSHMAALVDAGVVTRSEVFAENGLVVIVPLDNPAGIDTFDDLPRAQRVVVGADDVPVGRYTQRMLDHAAATHGEGFATVVRAHIVSRESNVRLVRAKVELGEADAAIVYRSDAAASDRVTAIPIPATLDVVAEYHLGRVATAPRPELAERFIAHVTSEAGTRILAAHGLTAPR